jgi:dihydrodipicolinate synthase/N-acetylneuraminate lyase
LLGRAGVDYYADLVAGNVEKAASLHFKLQALYAALNGVGTWPAGLKAGLELIGMRGGHPRAPIQALGADDRERIRRVLAETGVLGDETAETTPTRGQMVGAR